MNQPEPGKSAVLLDLAGPGTWISDIHVELTDPALQNAVIVECVPSGAGPNASLQVLDSADPGAGFAATVDPAGAAAGLVAYNKRRVSSLLPFVKVQLTVVAGVWQVRATPIRATNDQSIIVAGDMNLAQYGGVAVGPANPVDVSGAVDTELPAAALLADGQALPAAPKVGSVGELYNGATVDLARAIAAAGEGRGVARVGTLGEQVELAPSVARNAGGNGAAVAGLGWRKRYLVLLDLTAAAALVGDTLDVYVDGSLDGAIWCNIGHFTQCLGNGGPKRFFIVLDGGTPPATDIDVSTDAAGGVVRPAMAGLPQMRARWAIAGGGGQSFTFSVSAWAI